MRGRTLIIVAVIVVFSGFAAYAFRSALNPYVSFAQAAEATRTVQVSGRLVEENISYDSQRNELSFFLKDEWGTTAKVVYAGVKPNNMEHAESVVVAGKFLGDEFHARRLLVKCPSKYEEGRGK